MAPFQLRWYVSHRSSGIDDVASVWLRNGLFRRLIDFWLFLGVVCAVISMAAMIFLLTKTLIFAFVPKLVYFSQTATGDVFHTTIDNKHNQQSEGLVAVVPGVTVPLTQLPLFFAVLVIAGVFHEFGHAMAAKRCH